MQITCCIFIRHYMCTFKANVIYTPCYCGHHNQHRIPRTISIFSANKIYFEWTNNYKQDMLDVYIQIIRILCLLCTYHFVLFLQITCLKIDPFLCRYFVLIDPIEHARRRTTKFVLGTITIVWILSIVICSPPLMGWNNWPSPENWTIGKNFWEVHCDRYDVPHEQTLISYFSTLVLI